jgi:hypothetical protein
MAPTGDYSGQVLSLVGIESEGMAERKKQHVIPKCYLKAWCDPRTPPGQHPYVWRISRDGSEKTKKSPEKSFVATDKYTIKLPSGSRSLIIENTLGGIESDFVGVLSRIRGRQKLNLLDRARLCLFVAAMHTRTVAMGEHWKGQYQNLHDVVTALEKAHGAPATTSLATGRLVEHAHQHIIATGLEVEAPLLFKMQMAVLVTDSEVGFITSDNPCVWFNPTLRRLPPFYRSPGLAQPDIEVTLPLSPNQLLLVSHRPSAFYVHIDEKAVDEANRLTRFHCDKEFVSWKGETRPYWFERGQEPEDMWEKSEAGKKAFEEKERALEGLAGREPTEK